MVSSFSRSISFFDLNNILDSRLWSSLFSTVNVSDLLSYWFIWFCNFLILLLFSFIISSLLIFLFVIYWISFSCIFNLLFNWLIWFCKFLIISYFSFNVLLKVFPRSDFLLSYSLLLFYIFSKTVTSPVNWFIWFSNFSII